MAEGGARRGMPGQLEPRQRGRRTHLCCACDFPIAVYGRCAPCLHTFCATCAASMARCIICRAAITKLERIPAETGLFVSPLTLQGYRSEADLANHAKKVWGQLQELMAAGEGSGSAPSMHGMHGMAPAGGSMGGMPGMYAVPGGMMHSMHGMQGMHGMQAMYSSQQQRQQQQQPRPPGWKPPPPPGAPPPPAAYGVRTQQQQQQQQQQQPRQGAGAVMRPR